MEADAPTGNYLKSNGGANGTFTESPVVHPDFSRSHPDFSRSHPDFYRSQWNGSGGDAQQSAEGFLKGLDLQLSPGSFPVM